MGILDEAIREHLELKRQHGADDSELSKLEDQAFGQAERPGDEAEHDPAAEAPTEFMTQPETAEEPAARREPTIADLQEPPPMAPAAEEPVDEAPAEEEQPAVEHEIVADAPEAEEAESEPAEEPEPAAHSTEERHAIAEQPTELYDLDAELSAEGPPSPSDEELVEEEIAEPRLAPADPLAGLDEAEGGEVSIQGPAPDDDEEYEDEDDAFWNEQRLSDELDQALEAPRDPEPEPLGEPEPAEEPEPELELADETERDEEPEPAEEPEALVEEPGTEEAEAPAPAPRAAEEDVLEETPDFLEETPEDDQLWFEQKPPKDFDFDD
jgi:hypothetical protein